MRLWFLEKIIFYWIKPCLFFAEFNSPKSLFFYLTAASVFYFFPMNYKPLLHGWFKEPYALNYKKSCFYKQTPKYASYKAHGDGLASGWFMEAANPNCKMLSGQFQRMGLRHLSMSPSYSQLHPWHLTNVHSPKCLRPILVGGYVPKTCFH